MAFALRCDTCAFACTVRDEASAYVQAKEHERAHGQHFVVIETVEAGVER